MYVLLFFIISIPVVLSTRKEKSETAGPCSFQLFSLNLYGYN